MFVFYSSVTKYAYGEAGNLQGLHPRGAGVGAFILCVMCHCCLWTYVPGGFSDTFAEEVQGLRIPPDITPATVLVSICYVRPYHIF